jgi:hypothetical protein
LQAVGHIDWHGHDMVIGGLIPNLKKFKHQQDCVHGLCSYSE